MKWVYSARGRQVQKYRVLYDGDSTQLKSSEDHLELVTEEGDANDGGTEREEAASDGGVEVDNNPESDDEDDAVLEREGTVSVAPTLISISCGSLQAPLLSATHQPAQRLLALVQSYSISQLLILNSHK